MVGDLLLAAWPVGGQVLTSFRWATGYWVPDAYIPAANATMPILKQISSWTNATAYEIQYRCQGCFHWARDGYIESVSTVQGLGAAGGIQLGHAQSFDTPTNPACPSEVVVPFHDNGYGMWIASLKGVPNASYAKWAALATKNVQGNCTA
jgi:cellobiose dehydrogenase (acceptor)